MLEFSRRIFKTIQRCQVDTGIGISSWQQQQDGRKRNLIVRRSVIIDRGLITTRVPIASHAHADRFSFPSGWGYEITFISSLTMLDTSVKGSRCSLVDPVVWGVASSWSCIAVMTVNGTAAYNADPGINRRFDWNETELLTNYSERASDGVMDLVCMHSRRSAWNRLSFCVVAAGACLQSSRLNNNVYPYSTPYYRPTQYIRAIQYIRFWSSEELECLPINQLIPFSAIRNTIGPGFHSPRCCTVQYVNQLRL